MIFTAGDSHARWTFHDLPGFDVHKSLSTSVTMWRIGHAADGYIDQIVADLGLTAADKFILSAGEVDVRCHVWEHVQNGVDLDEMTRDMAARYVEKALSLPLHGAPLAILGIVPPVPAGEVYYAGVILPVHGTNEERALYTRTLNGHVERACRLRGVPFIDVYTPHADEQGLLRREVSDGNVHVIDTRAVRTELTRLGIWP